MAIVKNLMVRAGADFSGMQKGMRQAQNYLVAFKGRVGKLVAGIGETMAGIGAGFTIKDGIQDAMKFEAQMGTLSESLGDSMKDFVKWQNTVGASLGYSKKQS